MTIGEKRNIACAHSQGNWIAHWDDDDWYAPNWLSKQIQFIIKNDSDIVGLSELIFFSTNKKNSWKYIYTFSKKPWVAGATMMYKKELQIQFPFKKKQIGEDNDFVMNSGAKVCVNSFTEGFVSILHPYNTSPKLINSPRWVPFPYLELSRILSSDLKNYISL